MPGRLAHAQKPGPRAAVSGNSVQMRELFIAANYFSFVGPWGLA